MSLSPATHSPTPAVSPANCCWTAPVRATEVVRSKWGASFVVTPTAVRCVAVERPVLLTLDNRMVVYVAGGGLPTVTGRFAAVTWQPAARQCAYGLLAGAADVLLEAWACPVSSSTAAIFHVDRRLGCIVCHSCRALLPSFADWQSHTGIAKPVSAFLHVVGTSLVRRPFRLDCLVPINPASRCLDAAVLNRRLLQLLHGRTVAAPAEP